MQKKKTKKKEHAVLYCTPHQPAISLPSSSAHQLTKGVVFLLPPSPFLDTIICDCDPPPHPRRADKDFHLLAMQIKPSPINGPSFLHGMAWHACMDEAWWWHTRITRQNCQRGLGKQSDNQQLVELMDDTMMHASTRKRRGASTVLD